MHLNGYANTSKIYAGRRSSVFKGQKREDNRKVIIKTYAHKYPSAFEISNYKKEFEIGNQFDDKHIIKYIALESYENNFAIIEEDIDAVPLGKTIPENGFALTDFFNIALQIIDGLCVIHGNGIIHKDIGPSNIVIQKDTKIVKIIDFGLSSQANQIYAKKTTTPSLEGTLPYISPEQTGRMNRSIDFRTDLYSLGVTFYEMLCGNLPFHSTDPMELIHCHLAKSPVPLHEIKHEIPKTLSDIIEKLMFKNAENRYQSALGLKHDIMRCFKEYNTHHTISSFTPGAEDFSGCFQIPEKLYGREKDTQDLMAVFDRACSGNSELFLITGSSGIGKTAFANEIQKMIIEKSAYFISSSFDLRRQHIPYHAFTDAFNNLVQQLLTESDKNLGKWRKKVIDTLGSNGQLILDLIPELEHIIGPQPKLPELGSSEAGNRFNMLIPSFVQTFCKPDHPLVIFLDNLQWIDAASLKLIELLMTNKNLKHLLLIGAYQEEGMNSSRMIPKLLKTLEIKNIPFTSLKLMPLCMEDVNTLIQDTLQRYDQHINLLVESVFYKTDGNPFFVKQFLTRLYEKKVLQLKDTDDPTWEWNLEAVKSQNITANVVDLMVTRLKNLPEKTRECLQQASCMGMRFDLAILEIITQKSAEELLNNLNPAFSQGLVEEVKAPGIATSLLTTAHCRFSHNRVQQAAYALLDDEEKTKLHYNIGMIKMGKFEENALKDGLFDTVNHLNLGSKYITLQSKIDKVAELNLLSGKKAKESMAYELALAYFNTGITYLGETRWENQYKICLSLHTKAAESHYLNGDVKTMEEMIQVILEKAHSTLDKIAAYEIKIEAHVVHENKQKALDTGLMVLNLLGFKFPQNPGKLHVVSELLKTKISLAGKTMEYLSELPEITDPKKIAIVRIIRRISASAFMVRPELFVIMVFKVVRHLITWGNTGELPFYGLYGSILCGALGDYENGYKFGNLSIKLLDRFKDKHTFVYTTHVHNLLIRPWKEPFKNSLAPLLDCHKAALETGNLQTASSTLYGYSLYNSLAGADYITTKNERLKYYEIIKELKYKRIQELYGANLQLTLNLIGESDDPCNLNGDYFNKKDHLHMYHKENDLNALFNYYFSITVLNFVFEHYSSALEYSIRALKYSEKGVKTIGYPTALSNDSLIRLAICNRVSLKKKKEFIKRVLSNQKKLKKIAYHSPVNFMHRFLMVEAEKYRVINDYKQAMIYYQQAIEYVEKTGILGEKALANELFGKFFLFADDKKSSRLYMTEAVYCYERFGAFAKVNDLMKRYPDLVASSRRDEHHHKDSSITSTMISAGDLDMHTMIKTSQALSSEINLEKLLSKMMRIIIENAGAEKGFLILKSNEKYVIRASTMAGVEDINVHQSITLSECNELSQAIVMYVARTGNHVVFPEPRKSDMFAKDTYILKEKPQSILCTPIRHKDTITGVLYLENKLAVNAFTKDRIQVLQVLLSQAAISIENAFIYNHLDELVKQRTAQLEKVQKELIDKAHKAGMADVATETLHNVGNILNSVKTSNHIINTIMKNSKRMGLKKANDILREHIDTLEEFIINNPKGKKLMQYYLSIEKYVEEETNTLKQHIKRLNEKIIAIEEVVSSQQSYTAASSLTEKYALPKIVDDALIMMAEVMERNHVVIEKEYSDVPDVAVQKTKLIHILINIVKNTIEAMADTPEKNRKLVISLNCDNDTVFLKCRDTGHGIVKENLEKIFAHGFTTKSYGQGVGLHSAANYMTEMGGRMWAESEGHLKGTTFILRFI